MQGVDVAHQLWKLRHSKRISDREAAMIYRTLAENIQTYDQVTEVCGVCIALRALRSLIHHTALVITASSPPRPASSELRTVPSAGGSSRSECRDFQRASFLSGTRSVHSLWIDAHELWQVGVQFLQALNHFQRYAYVRQAHALESRLLKEQNTLAIPPSAYMSRTPSNRSESSLAGG